MTWFTLQAAVALVILGAHAALRWAPREASRIHRALLLALPLTLFGAQLHPFDVPYTPPAQVWAPLAGSSPTVTLAATPLPSPAAFALPAGVLLLASILPVLFALRALHRTLRGARPLRRLRGVEIWLAPSAPTPFAVWLGRPIVVLDPDTALDPALCSLAVRHELQHHRRHDPLYAWVVVALGLVSPLALLLRRPFAQAEELAVDAALVARGQPALPYARALAILALRPVPGLPALGMSAFLPRRISMLLTPSPRRPLLGPSVAATFLLLAAPLGWATDGLLLDHRPSDAAFGAAVAELDPAFVEADHGSVRTALDQLVATPNGRAWARRSLDNAEAVLPWVEAELVASGLPVALAGVPFVESGYRNRTESELPASIPANSRGAGYWMFIAPTARAYGLRVETGVDERLDLVAETDAAIALLQADFVRFGDWRLALAAYNQGESHVDRAIVRGGTRDAFALTEAGLLNDYAAQVYAAALVMAEPGLLGG